MKHLYLFNKQVELLLTEVSDGNMKAVASLAPRKLEQAQKNRRKAVGALGLSGDTTALVRVVYGQPDYCKFITLDTAYGHSLDDDRSAEPSDGILTKTPTLGLFLPLADCLGLVLFDSRQKALMVVHCGRHTLLQNGACRAVAYMTEQIETNPGDLLVWFSPCAGKGHYPLFEADNKGLQELAISQLKEAGVYTHHMELSSVDTTTSSRYFSHSQGDTNDRFAICAKLRSEH